MAVPTTISRYSFTEDTGDGLSGDVITSALIGLAFYDKVDALLAAQLNLTGPLMIGDDANAKMTKGLTLNQGAANDEILSLKSSGVAHGVTGETETDTYALFMKAASAGGLSMEAIRGSASFGAMRLIGVVDTAVDTTHTAAGRAVVEISASLKSGTGITDVGANGNLFAVMNNGATKFLVDAEGDVFYDGAAASYDEHDDVHLLRALEHLFNGKGLVRGARDASLKHTPDDVVELGLVAVDRKHPERGRFIAVGRHTRVINGAIWQLYERIEDLADRLATLERR